MTERTPEAKSEPQRLVGQIISGRYRIEELVGEGGMGAVYRAEHTHMRKRVAVKVLHPQMVQWAEAVERFEREAIAGAHIEHPNVAAATDFGKLDDGSHFLVMEYLEGEDLRSIIGRGSLPPERAVRVARQIVLALRAAHEIGVVHRDLKPENVMLLRKDREVDVVKVLDFGIAKVPVDDLKGTSETGTALTRLGMVYGTPEYMAPEQALGEEIDGRADLYALGVIFYEMLCGVRPFEADSRVVLLGMVATKRPPALAVRVPGTAVPPRLEGIVMRLLATARSDRWADAAAVLEAIDLAVLELDYGVTPGRASRVGLPPPARLGPVSVAVRTGPAEEALVAPPVVTTRGPGALPAPALLLAAGALGITLLVLGAAALRGAETLGAMAGGLSPASGSADPGASPSPEPEPDDLVPPAELASARVAGFTALQWLAERYPRDPAVLEALMLAHPRDAAGRLGALAVARTWLELSPQAAADEELLDLVRAAAKGPPEVASAAFELMSEKMGSRGPDLLYELAVKDARLKDRATKLLATEAVRRKATPALKIAQELRAATTCQAKKPLLSRAGEDGDERSVAILAPLIAASARGCGFLGLRACPAPCGAIAADIRAAIAAIEGRGG